MTAPTKSEINRALYGRKYKNEPTNGYPSKREAGVGATLFLLESKGKIFEVKRQVRFVLVPAQKGAIRNEKQVAYVSDFTYLDAKVGGKLHVVDAKGAKTKTYILKRKLIKFILNIEIEEL